MSGVTVDHGEVSPAPGSVSNWVHLSDLTLLSSPPSSTPLIQDTIIKNNDTALAFKVYPMLTTKKKIQCSYYMTWLLNKLLALIKALLWNCVCTQYVFRYFNLLHLWSLNIKLTVWCILWVAAVQSNVSLRSKRLIFVKEFIWMIKVIRCLIDVKHVFAECLWFNAKFSFLNFLSNMKTSLLSWTI